MNWVRDKTIRKSYKGLNNNLIYYTTYENTYTETYGETKVSIETIQFPIQKFRLFTRKSFHMGKGGWSLHPLSQKKDETGWNP